ncbi:MlaA family lipoprotein [Granulosicoccus sp. 3-233]|uniref:MlaA family lipoprotein n=1 Tax=Granulosicoccus sp. 3-233 TaxID=3417969 RepID=UPI003D339FC4
MPTIIRPLVTLLAMLTLSACASNPPTGPVYDPYEDINRKIYRFNTTLDNAILKPVARGYRYVVPDPVEVGIGNFFSNLDDITVIANDLLQGKFRQAGSDTGRFLYNSTAGVLGIMDFATPAGMVKHNESFGQTFGVWGLGEGPFVMLPLLGPNNARSSAGLVSEFYTTDIQRHVVDDNATSYSLTALEVVALRARLLSAGNLLDTAALDPYLLLRDFWVQQHRTATWDGKREVRIGTADDGLDDLDELDELDQLDALDNADELDELDELDRLDALDNADELDELDELDRLDALDKADEATDAGSLTD